MQFFPLNRTYDFMRVRWLAATVSGLLVLGSLVLLIVVGPNYGTDFRGGTELELSLERDPGTKALREAVESAGFSDPQVVAITDGDLPNHYMIRVREVATIDEAAQQRVGAALCYRVAESPECPADRLATEVKFSPGGDKIGMRLSGEPDVEWVRQRLATVSDIVKLVEGPSSVLVNGARVEVHLQSVGERMMGALTERLGADVMPDAPLRTEWIGPRAGAQLRDSAIYSLGITLVFIMGYIALRFDLRFAPGAVISLTHDAIVTLGVLTVLGHEMTLSTVAAVLTIVGYSVNDTVVVYDRIRENLGRLRGKSFEHLINVSLSEMLSRTILTNSTVVFSLTMFFFWGTGTIKEFAFTLIIGTILGTYSTIYIALPVTDMLDKAIFSRLPGKKAARAERAAEAT